MSVARVTELIAASTKSFDDAVQIGVSRAVKTLKNVEGIWIDNQKCVIKKGKISITVLLDKSKEELTWMPDLGEMVTISGKEVDPMTVEIGTELHFYVPKSQVATQ